MYAVVMFLKTLWDSHGVFTSAQDFFVSNSQSKNFELIQKPYVPRALRFSCQGPSRLREAKRPMGTRMVITFKTESARTSSSCWTKLCTKIIYTLLQAFVLLLQISYQKKSFLTTPNIENQSRTSAEFH